MPDISATLGRVRSRKKSGQLPLPSSNKSKTRTMPGHVAPPPSKAAPSIADPRGGFMGKAPSGAPSLGGGTKVGPVNPVYKPQPTGDFKPLPRVRTPRTKTPISAIEEKTRDFTKSKKKLTGRANAITRGVGKKIGLKKKIGVGTPIKNGGSIPNAPQPRGEERAPSPIVTKKPQRKAVEKSVKATSKAKKRANPFVAAQRVETTIRRARGRVRPGKSRRRKML